jgi:trans-aconitate methyltransferase
MADENMIVRERQLLIRREMERRGISVKQVQLDGGWKHPSTVLSYFPASEKEEPATMSAAALYRLLDSNALPSDLLSLLLPDGFCIVRVPTELDHDAIEEACRDYLAAKGQAHREDSPERRNIASCERDTLNRKAARLRAVA